MLNTNGFEGRPIRNRQALNLLRICFLSALITAIPACTSPVSNSGPKELIDVHYWGPPGDINHVSIEWVWLRTNATIKSDKMTTTLCIAKGVITNLTDKVIKVRGATLVLEGIYNIELFEMSIDLDAIISPTEEYEFHIKSTINIGLLTEVKSLGARLRYNVL